MLAHEYAIDLYNLELESPLAPNWTKLRGCTHKYNFKSGQKKGYTYMYNLGAGRKTVGRMGALVLYKAGLCQLFTKTSLNFSVY